MHALVRAAVPAIAGYVLGSFPTADVVSRSVDLRQIGDRNPGYWNAREALGARTARPVLIGDIGKGMAAAAIGRAVARPGERWPGVIGGGAAMVGHAWPLFARFRGGRAVATFGGVAGVLSPLTALVAAGAGGATYAVRRSGAEAVRVGFVAYPLAQLVIDGPRRTAVTGLLMSFVGLRFAMALRRVEPAHLVRAATPATAGINDPTSEGGDREGVGQG